MDLTVVIACKDREKHLSYCLSSLSNQDTVPKVVIVDFGSSNSLIPFSSLYDFVRVIRVNRNTKIFHKARAINIGIKETDTKWFCSTDADQIFATNFFSVVYNQLRRNKKYMVLCRTYFLRYKINDDPIHIQKQYDALLARCRQDKHTKMHGEGCCIGLPTAWLRHVNGWDERYIGYGAEDSDVIYRARIAGFKPVLLNNLTSMIHLPHGKNSVYYNQTTYFAKNKKLYSECKTKKQVVVNVGKSWGMQ